MRNKNVRLHPWPWQINLSFRARYWARKLRNLSTRSDWHAFVPTDEHADASEGGGDVIEPAELRQRLQQQQPPGRHPGLVAGVDLVMPSKGNTGIRELFSLWEQNLMPQNPATLIWVQATQIFKKKKKKKRVHIRKRATKFSTALRCFVFVLFHRCGPWLLCQEPDFYYRQNKSTQPVTVLRRHHYIITSRRGVLHWAAASAPARQDQLQCVWAACRWRYRPLSVERQRVWVSSCWEQGWAFCCWLDGCRNSQQLSALPPPLRLKLPVWLLEDKIEPKWMLSQRSHFQKQ